VSTFPISWLMNYAKGFFIVTFLNVNNANKYLIFSNK